MFNCVLLPPFQQRQQLMYGTTALDSLVCGCLQSARKEATPAADGRQKHEAGAAATAPTKRGEAARSAFILTKPPRRSCTKKKKRDRLLPQNLLTQNFTNLKKRKRSKK
jgi:hypothetical protein